jgi:hypothetical protein
VADEERAGVGVGVEARILDVYHKRPAEVAHRMIEHSNNRLLRNSNGNRRHEGGANNTGDQDEARRSPASPSAGKVALIIGGASEQGRQLAQAFAGRDMDVAVAYFNGNHELAARVKDDVHARGQRCLLISGDAWHDRHSREFSRQAVLVILETFGRLDVFVDLSGTVSFDPRLVHDGSGRDRDQDLRDRLFPHFNMVKAALREIVD